MTATTPLVLILMALLNAGVPDSLHKDIQAVVNQGAGSAEGRAAWERLSQADPQTLPHLLAAMDGKDIVVCNWLRTAFDRIVARDLERGGKGIDLDALTVFVKDEKRAGRARRHALELIEALRPGSSKRLAADWLNDPEFRYEAVALALDDAEKLAKSGAAREAVAAFHRAFEASRDVLQARAAAQGLLDLGAKVSVAEHLGFLTDWYLIGPFDGMNERSFHLVYPPEKQIDLSAEYQGKAGTVRWKRFRAAEAAPTSREKHQVLIDLHGKDALGSVDDAAGFAYTEIIMPAAQEVEFRGAADDNLAVWVNGKREFGFEEWRNGVRLDRHRFKVRLNAGKNTILVKICQSLPYIAPNWEFFLRLVDETEKGIAFKNGLPDR